MSRRSGPVVEMASPDTAQLRTERARRIADIRRLEWEFDRNATFELAQELRDARVALNDTEDMIATFVESERAQQLLERAESIRLAGLFGKVQKLGTS